MSLAKCCVTQTLPQCTMSRMVNTSSHYRYVILQYPVTEPHHPAALQTLPSGTKIPWEVIQRVILGGMILGYLLFCLVVLSAPGDLLDQPRYVSESGTDRQVNSRSELAI